MAKDGEGTGTTTIESDAAGEAVIDSLLDSPNEGTGDAGESGSSDEVSQEAGSEADGAAGDADAGTDSEGAGDEQSSEAGEGDGGETEFSLTEGDRDYSQDAYERAAAHYNRTQKFEGNDRIDPNSKKDRAMLRQIMERGEQLRAIKAEAEAGKGEEGADGEGAAEEARPATQAEPTAEQIATQRTQIRQAVRQFTEQRVNQEGATEYANAFCEAMWPGKNIKLAPEQALRFTRLQHEMLTMGVRDLMPFIEQAVLGRVPETVQGAYPAIGRVHEAAVMEGALETLSEAKVNGKAAYPDLDQLESSGDLKRAMRQAAKDMPGWNDKPKAGTDPVAHQAAKLRIAIRLARGERVNPSALQTAASAGAKRAENASRAAGAGKLPPGKTRGNFSTTAVDAGAELINSFAEQGGDKFGDAIRREARGRK